jgi:CheY-like chemotaxis protein
VINGSLPSKLSVEGASRARGEKVATPGAQSRPRILLIEDHADTAVVLSRMLGRAGYDVMHAASVAESQAIAAREMRGAGITLVVSDLGLPDGSGVDLMRELADRYDLVGIALSGFGMESDRERSKAAGFSRHLTKPVDANILRGTIAELIREIESS